MGNTLRTSKGVCNGFETAGFVVEEADDVVHEAATCDTSRRVAEDPDEERRATVVFAASSVPGRYGGMTAGQFERAAVQPARSREIGVS